MSRSVYLEVTNTSGSSLTISDGIGSLYTVLGNSPTTAYRQLNSVTIGNGLTVLFLWDHTTPWSFERGHIRGLADDGDLSVYVRKNITTLGTPYGVFRVNVLGVGGSTVVEPFWLPEDMVVENITVFSAAAPSTAGSLDFTINIEGVDIAIADLTGLSADAVTAVPFEGVSLEFLRNQVGTITIDSDNIDLGTHTFVVQIRYTVLEKDEGFYQGISYLNSPNTSGAYVQTANANAAGLIMSGTTLPNFTIAGWWRRSTDGDETDAHRLLDVRTAGSALLDVMARTSGTPRIDFNLRNDAGVLAAGGAINDPTFGGAYADIWRHLAITFDTSVNRLRVYLDGVMMINSVRADVDAFAAATSITFGSNVGGTLSTAVQQRNNAVWGRALTAQEIESLFKGGPWHNLHVARGDYTGTSGGNDPDHWWPLDTDFGTVGTDRGSAGNCNLTFVGAASIGRVTYGT